MIRIVRKVTDRNQLIKFRTYSKSTVPRQVDVVIVGGGSAGCHTLYHLSKLGARCVLLERTKLTAGTSWHTAGCVWSLRPSDVDTELLTRSRTLLKDLEGETGINPGWIQNGGIFIAHSKVRIDEYKRLSSVGRSMGIESHLLSPEETQKLFPLLNPKSYSASLYSPGDGSIDPTMLCNALVKGAALRGGQVFEDTPVIDILVEDSLFGGKTVKGVLTPRGMIRTENVVNATGFWGNDLPEKHGIKLPLVPMRHAYVVSESVPEVRGLPNIRDHDYSIYFRIQGESLCMGGYENNPEFIDDTVPSDFNFSLYKLNWSVFDTHIKRAVDLCPAFEKCGIKNTVCGPESFTPDHKPLMGPDPNLSGLFHHCGFNSTGMMFGGGCGEQTAKWILNGKPDLHMFSYDVRRFLPQQTKDLQWVKERSHESYAKNYSVIFENDQRLSGRNFIKDPLHDDMISSGAVMEEKQGWERPGFFLPGETVIVQPYDWYGSDGHKPNVDTRYKETLRSDYRYDFSKHHDVVKSEALGCRNNAAVFNMSYFCKMLLRGPDAQKAAQWLFTADLNDDSNRATYTCALNELGGVDADLTVIRLTDSDEVIGSPAGLDSYYIVGGAASAYYTHSSLTSAMRKAKLKAELKDLTFDLGIISIQGPKSHEILQKITNTDLSSCFKSPNDTQTILVKGKSSNEHKVKVIRSSHVGELGFELHIPRENCSDVYQSLMHIGKDHDLRNAGFRALHSLSSEKGRHLWGYDLRGDDTPIEANLTFCCRKAGSYRGKPTVDRQRMDGITRKMVYLSPREKVPLWGLEGVYRNGEPVGYLRRGDYAYFLDKPFGQAYINRNDGEMIDKEFLESANYQIDVMGALVDADVFSESPFDPENNRILGKY